MKRELECKSGKVYHLTYGVKQQILGGFGLPTVGQDGDEEGPRSPHWSEGMDRGEAFLELVAKCIDGERYTTREPMPRGHKCLYDIPEDDLLEIVQAVSALISEKTASPLSLVKEPGAAS